MKTSHLITVGKLKDQGLQKYEQQFLERFSFPKLIIHELKSLKEDCDLEAQSVLKKCKEIAKESTYHLVLLTERGKHFDSAKFSQWFYKLHENNNLIIFVMGGASGHGRAILEQDHEEISLSPLTFPHQLARVVFVEQYYRAQCIRSGHPYHK